MGAWSGRLHDLLTHFSDLELQTHLGWEGVQVACLEGSSGLSWWREEESRGKRVFAKQHDREKNSGGLLSGLPVHFFVV